MRVLWLTSAQEARRHVRPTAWPAAFVVALFMCVLPQTAVALGPGVSDTPSTTEPYYACPHGPCDSIIDPPAVKTASGYELPDGGPLLEGSGEKGGYDPKDLQSAYNIPTSGGSGQTVAVIDAYGDKTAESDLAKYREKYGLSACTKSNGCFKKVNEKGEEGNYPETGEYLEEDWELETALDLDMVSAACSSCHIMLVEATTQYAADTGESVNTAVRLGATEISNSYGYPENYEPWCGTTGCTQYKSDYSHAGVAITASSGDSGYRDGGSGVSFPAATPTVIAVGGTSLHKASNSRGWSEEVWNEPERGIGTGSGCSEFESKPAWQTDSACSKRTDNDVSAVAACETPVSVYSTPAGGWTNVCGTSASSPLLAAVEAHASEHTRAQGAEAFYKDTGALFDVTSGSNGTCTPPAEDEYLCHAEVGYDGPTGLGTPDGVPHLIGWSVEPTPLESGATESTLTGESCLSSTFCMSSTNYTTSERPHATYMSEWNGSEWVIQGLPTPEGSKEWWINGVSCTSTAACTAVGKYTTTAGVRKTLAERWNGTKWSVQSTPNPSGTSEAILRGVSCSSSTSCDAVGSYYGSGGSVLTLAEQWNGTEWKIQSTPNAPELSFTLFTGVSCASSTACMAVGFAQSGSTDYAWIEHWNGTEWVSQKIGSPSGARAGLFWSVSCTSSSACTAVGSYTNSSGTKVDLVNRWNGTEWVVQATPNEPSGSIESALTGVSCSSSTACMAVANNSSATRAHGAYAMKWNGTEWAFQALPEPSEATASWMYAVSCVSSTECTAGGAITNGSGTTVTLADGYF